MNIHETKFMHRTKIDEAEAEFLDIVGTKVLRVILLAVNSQLY
jgi:hypothetical protein